MANWNKALKLSIEVQSIFASIFLFCIIYLSNQTIECYCVCVCKIAVVGCSLCLISVAARSRPARQHRHDYFARLYLYTYNTQPLGLELRHNRQMRLCLQQCAGAQLFRVFWNTRLALDLINSHRRFAMNTCEMCRGDFPFLRQWVRKQKSLTGFHPNSQHLQWDCFQERSRRAPYITDTLTWIAIMSLSIPACMWLIKQFNLFCKTTHRSGDAGRARVVEKALNGKCR